MTINAYFIDNNWNYYEIFIVFEHVNDFHTNDHLIEIMMKILHRNEIQNRIQNVTIDNANDNKIMHTSFLKMLIKQKYDVNDFEKFFCLIHVIQLTLKKLFNAIHIDIKNENFQIDWNEYKNKKSFETKKQNLFYTLINIWINFEILIREY